MIAVRFVQMLLLIIFPALVGNFLYSQSSANTDPAADNAIRIYADAIGDQAPHYNGVEYRRYPYFIHSGHPFFMADSLINGTITYDGVTYEDVKLQYDEVNDALITTDLQGDNLLPQFLNPHLQFLRLLKIFHNHHRTHFGGKHKHSACLRLQLNFIRYKLFTVIADRIKSLTLILGIAYKVAITNSEI